MIAAPAFYAEHLGPGFTTADELLEARLPRPFLELARRSASVRGIALGWLARRGDGVAVIRRERGSLPALAVCALPPARRRIFVLELLRRPLPRSAWRRLLYRLWWKAVENPALGRGMAGAQVMTAWERDEYARHYELEPERIHHLPWAFCETGTSPPAPVRETASRVFASGRAACDWETFFTAASTSSWRTSVVCSEADSARVRELAAAVGADVRVEVPWAEHDRLLRAGDVCVIPIAERAVSAGHVRLMAAVEAGVPVVATGVRSLDGYTSPGETAVIVAPADPAAIRIAVDSLLADRGRREAIREAAIERARRWTYEDYFEAIGTLLARTVAGRESG